MHTFFFDKKKTKKKKKRKNLICIYCFIERETLLRPRSDNRARDVDYEEDDDEEKIFHMKFGWYDSKVKKLISQGFEIRTEEMCMYRDVIFALVGSYQTQNVWRAKYKKNGSVSWESIVGLMIIPRQHEEDISLRIICKSIGSDEAYWWSDSVENISHTGMV